MSWSDVLGHDVQIDRFKKVVSNGRLPSTFLFVGPDGIGKHLFARKLTQALFCDVNPEQVCEPCGNCPSCQQVISDTHPDLHYVELLTGKTAILTAQIVGGSVKLKSTDKKEEVFPGVCYELNLKPISSRRKVVIINDADFLNETSTSNLLKTLEEPPPGAVLILIGTSLSHQLDTIVSRSQVVSFNPLESSQVKQVLLQQNLVLHENQALELAMTSNGSVGFAVKLLEGNLLDVRRELLQVLPGLPDQPEVVSDLIQKYVNLGGDRKEKYEHVEFIASILVSCFHQIALTLSGQENYGDSALLEVADRIHNRWTGDVETVLACIDRTTDTSAHARANVNVKTLVEAWVDDLSQIWLTGGFQLTTP